MLQTAGYDPATAIVYRPLIDFPRIPDAPTRDQAVAAVAALVEVVQDFPYATEAHRAGWVAALLTTLSRYAFPGPAPLFLFDANLRGCGKSLQTDAVAVITTGRPMARMSLPRDDDETRKRITAIALAGEPLVLIDNINGTLGNASLDAALTATSWSDRILGETTMASGIPLYSTWFATGNNVAIAADTARRHGSYPAGIAGREPRGAIRLLARKPSCMGPSGTAPVDRRRLDHLVGILRGRTAHHAVDAVGIVRGMVRACPQCRCLGRDARPRQHAHGS